MKRPVPTDLYQKPVQVSTELMLDSAAFEMAIASHVPTGRWDDLYGMRVLSADRLTKMIRLMLYWRTEGLKYGR